MKLEKEEAIKFFSLLFYGEHHIPGKIKNFGLGWCVNCTLDIATWDYNYLTRLVFLAHDMCLRASINPSGPCMLKIAIHKRERNTCFTQTHPTLYQAYESWEKEKKKYNIQEVT